MGMLVKFFQFEIWANSVFFWVFFAGFFFFFELVSKTGAIFWLRKSFFKCTFQEERLDPGLYLGDVM